MKEEYTVEQLEKIFKEHSELFEIEEKRRKEMFGDDYIIPNLNISAALHVICREINRLQNEKQDRQFFNFKKMLDIVESSNFPID